MTKITLDQATLAKLNDLRERVEFCNEAGHTLGYFEPVPSRARSLDESLEVPFSEEELDRFEQEPGGRSLAEILADLEKKSCGCP